MIDCKIEFHLVKAPLELLGSITYANLRGVWPIHRLSILKGKNKGRDEIKHFLNRF